MKGNMGHWRKVMQGTTSPSVETREGSFVYFFLNGIYPFKWGNTCSLGDLPLELHGFFVETRGSYKPVFLHLVAPNATWRAVKHSTGLHTCEFWVPQYWLEPEICVLFLNPGRWRTYKLFTNASSSTLIHDRWLSTHFENDRHKPLFQAPCSVRLELSMHPEGCEKWNCCPTNSHFCYSRAGQDQIFADVKFRRLSAATGSIISVEYLARSLYSLWHL